MSKRTFGSVRVLPSKRVQARCTGPDGKTYSAPTTFQTKQDADAWLAKEWATVQSGTWEPPKEAERARVEKVTLTVGDYGRKVIARRKLRDSTRLLYTRLFSRLIEPTFGGRTLSGVTPSEVRDWYATMQKRPTDQANTYALLKSIFKEAVEDELIEKNPCRVKAGSQKSRAKEPTALTPKELADFLAAAPEKYRMVLTVAAWCGLRSGEVRGLRRRDLDLTRGVIRVEQQRVKLLGGEVTTKPKTAAGTRTIALPPHLIPIMRDWLKAQPVMGRDALLFPVSVSGLQRAHEKARTAIGKPDATIHGLRHTAATMAAQQGATTAELQQRFGWDTPGMASTYSHASRERDAALAARLSELAE